MRFAIVLLLMTTGCASMSGFRMDTLSGSPTRPQTRNRFIPQQCLQTHYMGGYSTLECQ